ncbi:Pkinase-domain-containing protein, partial [Rhizodiscina lignyota]
LTKNKSTGNLFSHGSDSTVTSEKSRQRLSFDEGAIYDMDRISKSPIIPEHEHGLGASGLRRIRQTPSATRPPLLPTRSSSANLTADASALRLPPPSRSASGSLISGPASPTINFSEDLTRFPSESLHSFSFAHQSEDSIYSRQNVLKRSIDFMRDKLGWAATNPGIAQAQAKLSGDQEVQSMMELLARANLIGQDAPAAHGLGFAGPITGPADVSGENVFEKSFLPRSQSPESMQSESPKSSSNAATPTLAQPPRAPEVTGAKAGDPEALANHISRVLSQDESPPSRPQLPHLTIPPRAALKRTLTSIDDVSLHNRLSEALAEPYVVNDPNADTIISPIGIPTTAAPSHALPLATPLTSAPHGHGNKWTPAAQAIFTTEAQAPWTITAANDLACLVFGVTRAEVRKLGILEVVCEERRKWLEEKLRDPDGGSTRKNSAAYSQNQTTSPTTTTLNVGSGLTARLLSKPNSRQSGGNGNGVGISASSSAAKRRAQTDDGSGSSYASNSKTKGGLNHTPHKSRGVLLCGDVVPIQKRNGARGAASLWVKEKRGGLIWVLEEIAEDVVYVTVDEVGCVNQAHGDTEAVWGYERIRRGMDVKRLIPAIPKLKGTNTGALDYDEISETRTYTAKTSNNISIPVTVHQLSGEPTFRVSSFPHIAGIMVLNAISLEITSSNTVFSAALFGQNKPDGCHINKLIPNFDSILHLMTDEDKIHLVDGIVIPEHSFRRARALLAMREGKGDVANAFLRPSGLPAKHRDGDDIMVDVQMRVVKSDRSDPHTDTHGVDERSEEELLGIPQDVQQPESEVVYALWITYSRQLHAANHGIATPLMSRPGTPPRQPSPGQAISIVHPEEMDGTGDVQRASPPVSLLTQQLKGLSSQSSNSLEVANPDATPTTTTAASPPMKKTIQDFVVLEDMGQGAYGQVKLCRYKKPPQNKVVIKYVTKRRILVDTWTRDRRLGTVPLEIHVLDYLRRGNLKHENIVEMSDFFEDDVNYYIEMVPHGLPGMDLFDYIELRVNMDEAECRKIFVQVAEAVWHLHAKAKVVHRDIKDENVVLDGEGRIKLIDFGSAAYIRNGPFDVFVGTIDYAAPEVLAGASYRGKEQDVWALGILLYTIVYKENPFYSIDEIMDHDLRVPYVMSEESIDLIRKMLNRDVEKRITIGQVLAHEWCR